MPHFGLMDEKALGPVAGPLQRARLHLRGGRRRLGEGKIGAGVVTLYDAVSAAMESYAVSGKRPLQLRRRNDLYNEKKLYAELVRSGVLDGSFDFEEFTGLMEKALEQELPGYDFRGLLAGVEALLLQLGVLPFDESTLPPEDPKTY